VHLRLSPEILRKPLHPICSEELKKARLAHGGTGGTPKCELQRISNSRESASKSGNIVASEMPDNSNSNLISGTASAGIVIFSRRQGFFMVEGDDPTRYLAVVFLASQLSEPVDFRSKDSKVATLRKKSKSSGRYGSFC
jgi:hypothetical protein